MPRVLINCSNLHNGGGVAVATSVLDCLSRMDHEGLSISVLLSGAVLRNLLELGTDLTVFERTVSCDFHGISALWQGLDGNFVGYELVFTVFGPAYFASRNTRHIFGFAQPNIIFPNNHLYERMGWLQRWRIRAKFELQAIFFSRADQLVVELEHVKIELLKLRLFQHKPIDVVYSCVHSVFNEPQRWVPLKIPRFSDRLRLGVISRNYLHKNLAILSDVKQHLLETYGREADMYVTFTPEEWANCSERFRANIINVGGLSLSQCPSFYEAMDGVVFPSLMECFSAVPIECMMMGRPLFGSNRSFISDVCDAHCHYFNPLDASDIARSIDAYFSQAPTERLRQCDDARKHVQRYSSPEQRAKQYLGLIKSALV